MAYVRRSRKSFTPIPDMIWDQKISTQAKAVYGYICRCAKEKTTAFPSYADQQEKCSIGNRRTISKAHKELMKIGLLSMEVRYLENGGKTSNLYTIYDSPNFDGMGYPYSENENGDEVKPDEIGKNKGTPSGKNAMAPSSKNAMAPSGKNATGNDKDIKDIEIERESVRKSVGTGNPKKDGQTDGQTSIELASPSPVEPVPPPPIEEVISPYLDPICRNIEYNRLLTEGNDQGLLNNLVNVMVDVMGTLEPHTVTIGKERKELAVVKSTYMKLNSEHIQYVIDRYNAQTNGITNKTAYLRTMLYNAFLEMDAHYTNAVHTDMPYLAGGISKGGGNE